MTSNRDLDESAEAVEEPVESDEAVTHESDTDEVDGDQVDASSDHSVDPQSNGQSAEAQRDEYLDALRRLQAEFENFRKRMIRQQTELLDRATQSLVERLLPVLDALDLARTHGESPTGEDETAFTRISSLLDDVLAKEGLERIDKAGVPFDPTIHDAVAHVERSGDEEPSEEPVDSSARPHMVSEVLRSGYGLKGRVLRPAMVKVEG